jgi:hypothetical protein
VKKESLKRSRVRTSQATGGGNMKKMTSTRDSRNKILIAALCFLGILSVGYGMIRDADGVFIFGILCVIGGYLLIRRKLQESLRHNDED